MARASTTSGGLMGTGNGEQGTGRCALVRAQTLARARRVFPTRASTVWTGTISSTGFALRPPLLLRRLRRLLPGAALLAARLTLSSCARGVQHLSRAGTLAPLDWANARVAR